MICFPSFQVLLFVSIEFLKCRLLKGLLAHPVIYALTCNETLYLPPSLCQVTWPTRMRRKSAGLSGAGRRGIGLGDTARPTQYQDRHLPALL